MGSRKISLAVASLAAAAGLSVGATQANAEAGNAYYCGRYLKANESCDGAWHHLFAIEGWSTTGTVCIDAYLDPKNNGHYSPEKCSSGSPVQFEGDEWGYGRIWPREPSDVSLWEEWGADG